MIPALPEIISKMDLGEAKEVYKVRIAMGAGSADKWIKYILNIQKMEQLDFKICTDRNSQWHRYLR